MKHITKESVKELKRKIDKSLYDASIQGDIGKNQSWVSRRGVLLSYNEGKYLSLLLDAIINK